MGSSNWIEQNQLGAAPINAVYLLTIIGLTLWKHEFDHQTRQLHMGHSHYLRTNLYM